MVSSAVGIAQIWFMLAGSGRLPPPMQRIPEPELMDDAEQAAAYAAADFSHTDAALVTRLLSRAEPQGLGPEIVDLGCGPGNISFLLAERCSDSTVLGLDGAGAMLALADQRRRRDPGRWPGLSFRLLRLPLVESEQRALRGRFTAIVSNSLLHHLHDPGVLWRSVRQLAAPGALVHIHDLRRPADGVELEAIVARHAATASPLLLRDYRASLRAAFRVDEVRQQLSEAGLESLRVRALGDRHLEVHGPLP